MKQLFKVIGLGLALWALSLIWLELNIFFLWPLFAGLVAGSVPAYMLGRWLNRQHRLDRSAPVRRQADVTRPIRLGKPLDPSVGPTRPSAVRSRPAQAAVPTRPMPVL